MYITWLGQSCFKIQSKTTNGETILITDPFDKKIGLKLPRQLKADIVTLSHDHSDHNNLADVSGISSPKPFIVKNPGEYEIKNIFIYGLSSFHDKVEGKERGQNIIYRFETEELSLVHLGDLGHSLNDEQLEKLQGTDILLVPVGGTYTLDAKEAAGVISQIEPRIVIPMHYKTPGLNLKIDGVDKFCKEMGVCSKIEDNKLKITKKDLPQEEMKIIIFG